MSSQKKEDINDQKMEPITAESLKSEKAFIKITKKHQKELEVMRKKQQKERTSVQKNQCAAIEKLAKSQKGRLVYIQIAFKDKRNIDPYISQLFHLSNALNNSIFNFCI